MSNKCKKFEILRNENFLCIFGRISLLKYMVKRMKDERSCFRVDHLIKRVRERERIKAWEGVAILKKEDYPLVDVGQIE